MANSRIVNLVSHSMDLVSVAEVKFELGITDTGNPLLDDPVTSQVQRYIEAATQFCQDVVYKSYGSAVVRTLLLPAWTTEGIRFDDPPLLTVDLVEYLDENDTWQTLPSTQYEVFAPTRQPGKLLWKLDGDFPALSDKTSYPVRVTYTSGDSPPLARDAAILYIKHLHNTNIGEADTENNETAAYRALDGERWGTYG